MHFFKEKKRFLIVLKAGYIHWNQLKGGGI